MQILNDINWLWYWHVKRRLSHVPFTIARWMPRWLVYHCSLRMIAYATSGKYGHTIVPEMTALEALDRWGHP